MPIGSFSGLWNVRYRKRIKHPRSEREHQSRKNNREKNIAFINHKIRWELKRNTLLTNQERCL